MITIKERDPNGVKQQALRALGINIDDYSLELLLNTVNAIDEGRDLTINDLNNIRTELDKMFQQSGTQTDIMHT